MPGIKSVTVYCGSAPGPNPSYLKLAANLGKAIAARGWRTVMSALRIPNDLASSFPDVAGATPLPFVLR